MKILHLSTFDEVGGAARAASRLHRGLLGNNVDSWMAVRKKANGNRVVLCGKEGRFGKALSALRPYVDALPLSCLTDRQNTPWNIAWLPNRFGRLISTVSPDIVHVHWVGAGFLSLHNLNQPRMKVVWTLHDSWPFTGGCHIINDCTAFRKRCGQCPQLGGKSHYDLSWLGWQRKSHLYEECQPVFVAPSRWMAEQARSSSLLANARIEVIPNGLDTNVFRPIDKRTAREMLRLPHDKRIVLFGAMSATSDPNKGFYKLKKILFALEQSDLRDEIELAIFGATEPANKPDMGFRTNYLGLFHDDISLAAVYSAADVMCVPSIQESFGQVAVEAMSCGIPVVAFGTSGLLDIIQHGVTGYLAAPYDEADFAKGIEYLLSNLSHLDSMSKAARSRAKECFELSVVASRYLNLYEEILSKAASSINGSPERSGPYAKKS